jgi:hypothetical protein
VGVGLGLGVGGGVSVGVGLGLGDSVGGGVGEGDSVGDGVMEGAGTGTGVGGPCVYPANDGVANVRTGLPASADVMKSCQMSAGIVPPKTSGNPSTFVIETNPSECPTQTQAASCGV